MPSLPTFKASRNLWGAGSLLVAGLLVTLLVAQYEKSEAENEAKRGFVLNCMEIQARIQNRLAAHAQILRGGAAFFARENGITRQEWREFAERQKLDQNFPGIQGIGFMVLVPPGELSEHVRKIRAEGFPDYRVKPEGEREGYAPVIYLEPFSGLNLRAFGYDTFSEPVRREAMERARDNDEAALSGKVLLLQETGTDIQAGVLMYVPAYRPGLPHGTVAERRAALLGWAYIACRMNDFMEGILGREDFREKWRIHLKVFDGATSSPEALLYNSDTSTDEKSETGLTRQIPIDAAGHEWLLSFSQSGGTGVQANYGKVWLCLGSGTMISLLLSGLFFSLQNTRFNARRQAEKLTADLRQRKAALKESEANFRSFFETVTDMIIVGTTDGRTLFTNSAVTQTLGYTPEELARMPLLDLHPADLRPEARKIFAAMFRGERATCPLPLARKDGVLVPVETRVWLGRWNAEDCIFGISKNLTAEQEAQQRFERLFRRSPAIMAVSKLPERRFSDVNDAFLATLGYSREEVIGKTAAELGLFPNPDQVAALTEMLLANRRISNIELQVRCKNGEIREGVFCGEVIISQGRRHFLTVMLDITERMKAIEELKKERRRLEGIIEATHVGTWEHNVRTGATVFNDRWAEIIGYTLDEISPVSIETWIRFAHPDDLKASNALLEKHCRGELDYYEFELRMKHKDGRWVWVLDRGKVVSRTNDGQPLMVMGTHQDITARKDMERELHEALERAEASARAKADFLSVMSHELRNPLNGVLGFAELLSDSPLDEEQREWAQAINSSGNHLLAIVNDILDFSSIEKGTLTIHPAPFAVAELVKRVAEAVRKNAADKRLKFRCEVDSGVPEQITGDARRIRQILINLLANAVKFTPAGSVVLRVTRSGQRARAERPFSLEEECSPNASEGSFLDFSVEDTGIGISPEAQGDLFHRFTQADPSISRRFGGTGLGLAISKHLAEAMGGSIAVTSTPGKGSTFTFRLPLESAPVRAGGRASATSHISDRGRNKSVLTEHRPPVQTDKLPTPSGGGLVLVVDDDGNSRALAGRILMNLGYRVTMAADGNEAIAAFSRGGFSAILMDLAMPEMDGLEAARKIREIEAPSGSRVPIIAFTANVMSGDRERCFAAGMDDFLTKPFKKDELAVKLASAAARKLA